MTSCALPSRSKRPFHCPLESPSSGIFRGLAFAKRFSGKTPVGPARRQARSKIGTPDLGRSCGIVSGDIVLRTTIADNEADRQKEANHRSHSRPAVEEGCSGDLRIAWYGRNRRNGCEALHTSDYDSRLLLRRPLRSPNGLRSLGVIFDRSSRFCLPVDVRLAPKATLDVNGDRLKRIETASQPVIQA